MLTHLFVSNYALIDQLELDFNAGLTTITGETGAGKSILLGALKLVLGERAELNAVKNQAQKCIIEATFNIANLGLQDFFEDNDIDYEDFTIFRREILPSGKSRAFINDVPIKLNIISTLSSKLIDIHSQFETADLLNPTFQFEWIDAVAAQQNKVNEFKIILNEYKSKKNALKKLEIEKETFEKELDYNQFLYNELAQVDIKNYNLEDLEREQHLLENTEETAQSLSEASQILDADALGVIDLLAQLQVKAKYFSEFIPESDLKSRIDSLLIEANDVSAEIQLQLDRIEADPQRLREVQSTLNQLHTLLQKHQVADLEELLQIKEELSNRINLSFSVENKIADFKIEIQKLEKKLDSKAQEIRENRFKVIPSIEKTVVATLKELGMAEAQLQFELQKDSTFNPFGKDQIQLLFTANKGMNLQSIEKSASGGERSRLMLAIKESVSKNKELPTLILDEIDTGVSGKVAGSIGAVMHRMASHMQVIAITHLPQVAAFGKTHLKVIKSQKEQTTVTSVRLLNHAERVQELAEIMSGDIITQAAKKQAEELLKLSN